MENLLVWKAYIDDSLETDKVLILAGYIACAKEWDAFSVKWKTRLGELRLAEFKMVQRVHSYPEMNGYLYKAIEEHVHCLLCIAAPIEPLKSACKTVGLPYSNDLPYHMASKALTDTLAQMYRDPVDFTFDEQDQISKTVCETWPTYLKNADPFIRENMGQLPMFGKSVMLMPLQAADMAAYWYRRRWIEEGSFENPSLPFPWSCKVDYPRHLLVLSEKDYVGQLLDAWLAFRRMTFNVTVSFTYKGRDIFG